MQLFLTDPLLEGLNDQQIEAVKSVERPIQLVASAGSGKTTVLTRRIAYMLNEGIKPENIFAVTFTKKAADEMISRLKSLVNNKKLVEKISIGTYHSLLLQIIKKYFKELNFTKEPTLCLENRQMNIIKTIIDDLNSEILKEEAISYIGKLKNMGIFSSEFSNMINKNINPINIGKDYILDISNIYKKYQDYLLENDLIDFDDILLLTRKLLQDNQKVRYEIQSKYKYVLVDEFQDVNKVQYDISRIIASPENNIFVVGDDYQSIYEFRGSDVNIILNFSKDYKNTKLIKLESNYRSTPEIISISNKLIKNNLGQIEKNVKSENKSIADSVNYYVAEDIYDESFYVAKQIRSYIFKGIKPEEIAVLYRTHSQSAYLEEDLVAWNIPYTIHKNTSFYDLNEVQDLLAFLRLARNKEDDLQIGFERLFKFFNLNKITYDFIKNNFKSSGNLMSAFIETSYSNIHPGQRILLNKMIDNILRWQKIAENNDVAYVIDYILESSGYKKRLENKHTESAENSLNILESMYDKAIKWKSKNIDDFFKEIQTQEIKKKENKNKKNAVQLMTIHNSKGMEFDVVFLIGLEENKLPSRKSIADGNIQEERRLCYVALTRARKYLHITRAKQKNSFGKVNKYEVSRFWHEINS
ncbi:MAG: DNA helicase [Candidatus Sericytochromatia bacterium]|nr:MAG: DNA helicase [Candidatus Sericytochromatia bacterium]